MKELGGSVVGYWLYGLVLVDFRRLRTLLVDLAGLRGYYYGLGTFPRG